MESVATEATGEGAGADPNHYPTPPFAFDGSSILARVDLPAKGEFPLFNPDVHEVRGDEEIAEMYRLRAEYIENLKAAKTSDETG